MADDKTPAPQAPTEGAPADKTPAADKPVEKAPAADAPVEKAPADKPVEKAADDPTPKPDAPAAPVKYALAVPAGSEVWLTEAELGNVARVAGANNWTNDQAQAFVNARVAELKAQSSAFLSETAADPTYGGDHLIETQQNARRVLERFAPAGTTEGDALRRDLDKEGYGNKLSIVSFLARIGKTMAEDSPATNNTTRGPSRDPAAVLYGATTPPTT